MDAEPEGNEMVLKEAHITRKGHKPTGELADKLERLRNYTTDQKCEAGMDFGVGFQIYTPYVDMGSGG